MDRRHYLALVGSGLTLAVSGCAGDDGESGDTGTDDSGGDDSDTGTDDSGGDDSDTGTDDSSGGNGDTGTEDGGENGPAAGDTPAKWTNWLAADTVTGRDGMRISRIDLQGARDHLPDLYADVDIERISGLFGVAEESIDDMILVAEDGTPVETIMTGGFSADTIRAAITESPDEQYAGFDIFRKSNDSDLGVADGTILLSNSVRRTIDAERGETQRLTDADADWNTMLSDLGNSPVAYAGTGVPSALTLTPSPERVTRRFTSIQNVYVEATYRYQYTDKETAATAIDSDEEAFLRDIGEAGVLHEIDQQGKLVVVGGEVPSEKMSIAAEFARE